MFNLSYLFQFLSLRQR